MSRPGAIAVFVKTIGRSPVKTRLAAEIGPERATEFYRLCLIATHVAVRRAGRRTQFVDECPSRDRQGACGGVLPLRTRSGGRDRRDALPDGRGSEGAASCSAPRHACGTSSVEPYWAVAEAEAIHDPTWSSFSTIAQGDGDLGDRLDRVYRTLLGSHSFVILIGADAPLMSAEMIASAAEAMSVPSGPEFAISRAGDGGYALFAGRVPIPTAVWRAVPYSSSRTAEVFVSQLQQIGGVAELPPIDDIDTFADLTRLVRDAERFDLLPAQSAVVNYARHLLARTSGVG